MLEMFSKLGDRFKQWRSKRKTSPAKHGPAEEKPVVQEVPQIVCERVSRPKRIGGELVSSDGIAAVLPPRVQILLEKNRPIDSDDDEKFDIELALKAMKMIDRLNQDEPLSPDSVLLTPSIGLNPVNNDPKARTPPKIGSPNQK